VEYYIEIAFLVWSSVNRHALSSKNYGILGFNDLPRRGRHFHASSIKMCEDDARKSEKGFREGDRDVSQEVIARPFKRLVWSGF
jgi:hypothetical protein